MRALVREGQTRGQVAKAVGVHPSTVSRIVRDTEGLDFARTGQGSSGTPEAMAKARGYRSEYMRERREAIADRLLGQMDKTLDILEREEDARKRQALMQGLDAAARSYTNVTKPDAVVSEQEAMQTVLSTFDQMLKGVSLVVGQADAIAERIRQSGETDPRKIYGEDGQAEVGTYGARAGDVLRDGRRRATGLIQE
ncbi:helix-turn-helix domain-containing protein [Microbacterium sp. NPDC056057]|uniref:helix-turn-helix domain-containing protein n=1 Tax=Microbacterium sp. NPDC056057 TaxID=3345699 RepID=UPI0035D5D4F0